jgi:hypothetical protein
MRRALGSTPHTRDSVLHMTIAKGSVRHFGDGLWGIRDVKVWIADCSLI